MSDSNRKKYADIRIDVTVSFEDDSLHDLRDQAIEAAEEIIDNFDERFMGMAILGPVRETESPAQ